MIFRITIILKLSKKIVYGNFVFIYCLHVLIFYICFSTQIYNNKVILRYVDIVNILYKKIDTLHNTKYTQQIHYTHCLIQYIYYIQFNSYIRIFTNNNLHCQFIDIMIFNFYFLFFLGFICYTYKPYHKLFGKL